MSTALEYETFDLVQVCKLTGAPSPDWLSRLLNAGELTGILSGKNWRMTQSDMARVVAHMRRVAEEHVAKRAAKRAATVPESGPTAARPNAAGLSARSAARLRRRATP